MMKLHGKRLIIRSDANTQIGIGHLMRCLALAQAWKDTGGDAVFITACNNEGLLKRLGDEGFEIHTINCTYPNPSDLLQIEAVLDMYPNSWVILDGYNFDEKYQLRIKEKGHQLLVIDDLAHLDHYYADIVLNQNLYANKLVYLCEPYTSLLLGTHYTLLRREFLVLRDWKRKISKTACHILITFGGSDLNNYTLKAIQALEKMNLPKIEVIAVIGGSNVNLEILEESIGKSMIPTQLVYDPKNMPELMMWADIAISSAGTTAWELLFLGLPSIFFVIADNQELIAEGIANCNAGLVLGRIEENYIQLLADGVSTLMNGFILRKKISRTAQRLVDGKGFYRVLRAIDIQSC